MIVKVWGIPAQLTAPPVKLGVTIIVAITGVVRLLLAMNEEQFPFPFPHDCQSHII